MNAALRTPRLALRPLQSTDHDALHALLIQPGVRRYLLDGNVFTRAQSQAMLEQSLALHAAEGTGLWALASTDAPFLGFVALWPFHDPPTTELAYALDDAQVGRGYATEAALAMLEHARERLGWRTIEASTDAPNVASQRVLERLGFDRYAEQPGGFGTLLRYRRALTP